MIKNIAVRDEQTVKRIALRNSQSNGANMMKIQFKRAVEYPFLSGHLNLGGARADGKTTEVNSRYLVRDGKPWVPVMGEYHFSRAKRESWREELAKMKAGGITVVSTYLFWIYHEEEEEVFDFSGDRDVRSFVNECGRAGLDVFVRIGPWCHGECRNGGFPDWLLKKDGMKLRSNDAAYLKIVRRLFGQYGEQLGGMFWKDGGAIIGVQVENELTDDAAHLSELKKIAQECGIDAPLWTVTGWNRARGAKIPLDGVLPVFAGYCDAPWAEGVEKMKHPPARYFFLEDRNDSAVGADLSSMRVAEGEWQLPYHRYPFLTCELGGGLQSTHHRRYAVKPMDVYAAALVTLGCGNNLPGYYVYHGGTNKTARGGGGLQESRATGYPNDYPILNYDYGAPLSEYGEVRGHYRLLNLLHLFLADFQADFAVLSPAFQTVQIDVEDRTTLRCAMRTDGRRGFVFVNHYQRLYPLEDVSGAVIDTGAGVVFPPIDVCGETAFFLPFRMKLEGIELEYATAQPLCRDGKTFFFAEIPGIPAEYQFSGREKSVYVEHAGRECVFEAGDSRIVTLTWNEAQYLRKLDGTVYLGEDGCDLYLKDGKLNAVRTGRFEVQQWTERGWLSMKTGLKTEENATVVFSELAGAAFEIPAEYEAELELGRENAPRIWMSIDVSSTEGMIDVPYRFDNGQIYADGELIADCFYDGRPWRIPAKMLFGKTCYLVMTPWVNDGRYYAEFS